MAPWAATPPRPRRSNSPDRRETGPSRDPCLPQLASPSIQVSPHLQVVVEEHQVGAVARRDAAEFVIEPQERGRGARGHAQRDRQRRGPGARRVAHGARHVEIGAGERAVGRRQPCRSRDGSSADELERPSGPCRPTTSRRSPASCAPVPWPRWRCAGHASLHVVAVDDQPAPGFAGSSSAAPTGPGSRPASGGMALNRCVNPLSPLRHASADGLVIGRRVSGADDDARRDSWAIAFGTGPSRAPASRACGPRRARS